MKLLVQQQLVVVEVADGAVDVEVVAVAAALADVVIAAGVIVASGSAEAFVVVVVVAAAVVAAVVTEDVWLGMQLNKCKKKLKKTQLRCSNSNKNKTRILNQKKMHWMHLASSIVNLYSF